MGTGKKECCALLQDFVSKTTWSRLIKQALSCAQQKPADNGLRSLQNADKPFYWLFQSIWANAGEWRFLFIITTDSLLQAFWNWLGDKTNVYVISQWVDVEQYYGSTALF